MSHHQDKVYVAIDIGASSTGVAYCAQKLETINYESLSQIPELPFNESSSSRSPSWVALDKKADPETKFYPPVAYGEECEQFFDEEHFLLNNLMLHLRPDFKERSDSISTLCGAEQLSTETALEMVLAYLAENIREQLENKVPNLKDIEWIIVVPSICDESVRKLVRNAAMATDMIDVTIVSDADCSLIFANVACQKKNFQNQTDEQNPTFTLIKPGNTILVVDCGGASVDTTSYRVGVSQNNSVTQIMSSQCLHASGNVVDENFLAFIREFLNLGSPLNLNDSTLERLLSQFRTRKSEFSESKNMDYSISIDNLPVSFDSGDKNGDAKPIQHYIDMFCARHPHLHFDEPDISTFKIPKSLMKSFFVPVVEQIRDFVRDQVSTLNDTGNSCDAIVLDGGFGHCELVQEAIEKICRDTGVKFIQPSESAFTVPKGAICLAFEPLTHELSPIPSYIGLKTSCEGSIDEFVAAIEGVEQIPEGIVDLLQTMKNSDGKVEIGQYFLGILDKGVNSHPYEIHETQIVTKSHSQNFQITLLLSDKKALFSFQKGVKSVLDVSVEMHPRSKKLKLQFQSFEVDFVMNVFEQGTDSCLWNQIERYVLRY